MPKINKKLQRKNLNYLRKMSGDSETKALALKKVQISQASKVKPYLNILTRTNSRPKSFERCHNSIKNQTYKNIRHIVSIDDLKDKDYVEKYDVDWYFVDRQELEKLPDIPNPNTGMRFIYNKYLNVLIDKVKDGWVMILDDDDYLADNKVVEKIMSKINHPTDMIIQQMQYPNGKVLPSIQEMHAQPRLGRIGSPCVVVHNTLAKAAKFDGWKCGDFRYITKLWKLSNDKKWIKTPIVKIGNFGGMGRREDIVTKKKTPKNKGKLSPITNQGILDRFNKNNVSAFKSYLTSPYIKRSKVDYDTIIVVGSYNRYDKLQRMIAQLYQQDENSKYSFKLVCLNDGSTDKRYDQLPTLYPQLTYIKNKNSNGKYKYWRTISQLFGVAKKYKTHAVLQMDDDFILCDNFLDRLMDCYFRIKENDNAVLGVSYHLYGKNQRREERWNCPKGSWADGGCLYDIRFLQEINYNINPIPMSRWRYNKKISSGVWQQVSFKVNSIGGKFYKTRYSLVNHDGLIYSSMGRGKKSNHVQHTDKFIDNYENATP